MILETTETSVRDTLTMFDPKQQVARFLSGMPRSGTEWVTQRLNTHPDVAAFGESLFWARCYIEPDSTGHYSQDHLTRLIDRLKSNDFSTTIGQCDGHLKNIGEDDLPALIDRAYAGVDRPITPVQAFLMLAEEFGRIENKRLWVEKSIHNMNWVDRIIGALPKARIIITLREPYGFMLSYKHQADRYEPEKQRALRRAYHPLWAAIVWRGSIRAARSTLQKYPEAIKIIWLHEIQDDPDSVLRGVQEFLCLPVTDLQGRSPKANSSFPSGQKPKLKPQDIFWMNLLNTKLIRAEGFKKQRTPIAPFSILLSILYLPVWATRNYLAMRQITEGSVLKYLSHWFRSRTKG